MPSHPRRAGRFAALLAVLVGLVLGGLAAPASAALAVPKGLKVLVVTPPNQTADDVVDPILQWDPVRGATRYTVEVLDLQGTVMVSQVTSNRRFTPVTRVPSSGTWRVRATDGATKGPWASAPLETTPVDRPTLLGPTDDATVPLPQPSEPPVLRWNPVRGAEQYVVEVSRDSEFVAPTTYHTESTAHVLPRPAANETYWWRVTADLGDRYLSPVSEEWSFTIGRLAEVTGRLVEDADEWQDEVEEHSLDNEVTDIVFDWDPVPGAVTYELWVSTDRDFNDTAATVEKLDGITGTRYSPALTYDNDDYYWKVRGVNARGETVAWPQVTRHDFTRSWDDVPALVEPADGATAVGDPFSFQWEPVQHASRYELQIGTDPTFTTVSDVCTTAGTTYTPTGAGDCAPEAGARTYWRVRGLDRPGGDDDVQGLWSARRSFVYSPAFVRLLAPAPGASVAVPTLRWAPTRSAERYTVTVRDAVTDDVVQSATTYARSWTPDLQSGAYTWSVQYLDTGGRLSVERRDPATRFTVTGTAPASGQPPLTPLSGTDEDAPTTRFPSLSWEPMPQAAYYKVSLGAHGTGVYYTESSAAFLRTKFRHPAATDTTNAFMAVGSYDWLVTAYSAENQRLGAGPVATFTIAEPDPVSGQRLALTGRALDADATCTAWLENPAGPTQCVNVPGTPVLAWDPVPDAAYYELYLSYDRSLTNLVYPVSSPPTTTNTRWTPSAAVKPFALPDSEAGKPYHWVVRPCTARGFCSSDPRGTKNVAGHAFDKRSPQPRLRPTTTPANDITFTWDDYLTTNLATPYVARDGAPAVDTGYQSARQYRIEVSTTRDFTNVVDTRLVDQPTHTAYSRTYPEGPLYWRVQAVDDAGNGLAWSVTGELDKKSKPPTLLGPLAGTPVDGTATLRWEWNDFARSYTVEVYANNDDETISPANRLFTATTEQTAFVYDQPIPAASKPYVWRVRRTDVDGRAGAWSDWGWFRSRADVPTAWSTARRVSPGEELFTWRPVAAAARYRFELREVGESRVSSRELTYAAWAPTSRIADGEWEWRVLALDAHKGILGDSGWTRISVDGTPPEVTSTAPASTAKPRSVFTVRFSEPVTGVTQRSFGVTRKGISRKLPAIVTLRPNGRVATLDPSSNLRKGQTYVVRLTAKIKDPAGNALEATSWRVKVS